MSKLLAFNLRIFNTARDFWFLNLPPPRESIILFFTEEKIMNQISRFVIWICARFNREQIELIVKELSNILKSKQDFPTKPKDAFKEQHPNYREYNVDPTPPLTEPAKKKTKI